MGRWDLNLHCHLCPEGKYCPRFSTGPGLACPPGFYCPGGTMDVCLVPPCDSRPPISCNPGRFSGEGVGLISASDCVLCNRGSWCGANATTPSLCGPGTFQPNLGARSKSDCLQCISGTACPSIGAAESEI